MTVLNGVDVNALSTYRQEVERDPAKGERLRTVVAHWVGGARARVENGDMTTYIGGDNELNPMEMLLACLAACDIDLIVTHASLLGLSIETLSVEVSGHFDIHSYLDLPGAHGSGYDSISYTVHACIPGITPQQIAYLRERCEKSSPVGHSLSSPIPMTLEVQIQP